MIIIDRNKNIPDYYDWLGSLDKEPLHFKTRFDRWTEGKILPRNLYEFNGSILVDIVYQIWENSEPLHRFSDCIKRRTDWGKYYIAFSVIEVGRTYFLLIEPINIDSGVSEKPQLLKKYIASGERLSEPDNTHITWYDLGRGKIEKGKYECESIIQEPIEYPEQLLEISLPSDITEFVTKNEFYPHLKSSWGISDIIKAEEIYYPLENYLRELQFPDKPMPDNRTNNEKILSAGFDLKTSFRK